MADARPVGRAWDSALDQRLSLAHGTTAAISARKTSRFVRFFFPAKSSDACADKARP